MRVFDTSKAFELTEYDLTQGELVPEKKFKAHHEEEPMVRARTAKELADDIVQQGGEVIEVKGTWYKVTRAYPNGGKEVEVIVPVAYKPAKPAWDEYEDILVYRPFTAAEQTKKDAQAAITEAKAYLKKTDYIAMKLAEALAYNSDGDVLNLRQEYAEQLKKRAEMRALINEKEALL